MSANSCIPELPLSSGSVIPLLGFGTAASPFKPESIREAVLRAIKLGYRHFDTAALYQSETPLGEAVMDALELGLIKSRQELFVTSKLWCNDAHPHLVLPALQATLRNLGMEYLDLYLIHWPMTSKPSGKYELYMDKEDGGHGFQGCMGSHGRVSKAWACKVDRSEQLLLQEAPNTA